MADWIIIVDDDIVNLKSAGQILSKNHMRVTALRSGRDVKGALIGTGVCASHGMERTHLDGIAATLKLLYLYLCGED